MRTSVATRCAVFLVCAIILTGLVAPQTQAAVTIDIGDYRAAALDFVQQKFGLSRDAAITVMHRYEDMHGAKIIDTLDLPEGAVLDFVRVDGNAPDPSSMVTFEGSGVLREAHPRLFYPIIREVLEKAPPGEREHVLANIREALKRGWFVQTITQEQRDHLLNYRLPGEKPMRAKAPRRVRILVVLNNFPYWNDISPSPGAYDSGGDREHPVSEALDLHTPGGHIDTTTLRPAGLDSPTWSATGEAPQGGTNASVSNHPRLEYTVSGRTGTSVDLKERWFDFLFNVNNPLSVTNYYYANSHANIAIEGDRSDIVGPLESHHILDRIPYLGGPGHDYAIQPGTPIVRREPGTGLWGVSADSGEDLIGTLGYNGTVSIGAVQIWDDANSEWDDLEVTQRVTDPYDSRRYIVKTASFDDDDRIRARIGGTWRNVPIDAGFSLDDTTFTSAEIIGSEPGNRLLSMCYYTHDHIVENGRLGTRPYQLRHMQNSAGRVDDILGTVDDPDWHYIRPFPYDHDVQDHRDPNWGYFEDPNSVGAHNFGVWLGHLNAVMNDNGIAPSGYSCRINLYPSDAAGSQDTGGTSGPWSGTHVFIPNSSVVLPSDAGLYLAAHELGHALAGFPDLYDLDFYTNATGVDPPLFECSMIGPYSVMAHGGRRIDAFLKTLVGWVVPVAVTEDIIGADLPEIEGTLENPVIYKLPGRPHYIANDVPPDQWKEFFLVENRNRTGANYFNDISPRGMYIYHVDLRFGQTEEWHPAVIVEQADGLYELERNPDGQWGDLEGDPFPGSTDNRNFTQLTEPHSWSHGWVSGVGVNSVSPKTDPPPEPPPGVLQPGSSTDSFSRVANISDPGTFMTADLYVVPREVIATQLAVPPPDADDEDGDGILWEVKQGTEDCLMMHLKLDNDSAAPNLSRGDVELATIRIDENGSSQDDPDTERLSLFDDTNGNGVFEVDQDTRIATSAFQSQTAYFTDLNYRIPLDEQRDLFVTYDVSPGANAAPGISLGAGIAQYDYIRPEIPGAVQRRVRQPISGSNDGLGAARFPINSTLVAIDEAPDTVTVTPTSRAPIDEPEPPEPEGSAKAIEPGDQDVPILSLTFEVDQDRASVTRIRVDETGTINAVSHVTAAKLYHDLNADGVVDPGDTLLEETTFASVAGTERASFDIQATPVDIVEGSPQSVLLTASLSDELPLETPPLTLQYTLVDTSYITLGQVEDIVSDENFPMSSEEVSTPIPNEPPAAPENLAATVLGDGSILLSWELSNDDPDKAAKAGENDVTEYHIYRSTQAADLPNMTPADVYAIVAAGTTEFNDLNAPLGVDLYYMMRAYDGVQEGPDSNIAGPVQATDNLAPTFSEFDPAQGADGVPRDTTIAFTIEDNASGIDQSTLVFEVDGVDVAQAPETTITGSAMRLRVEYDPPADYDFLQEVTVSLQVADNFGNVAPAEGEFESYDFTVEGPPTFSIAGVITDADGNPEEGVRVTAGQLFADTNAQGEYEVTGLSAGDYTVVPSKDGRSFSPEQRGVTVGPDAVAIDFTSAPGYDIAGTVETGDGDPLAGVTVSAGRRQDITGQDGTWEISDVPAGDYTLRPRLAGWVFDPTELAVTVDEQEGDALGLLFTASVETFDVTGVILTTGGDRLAGIQVDALQNDQVVATAHSGANGAYSLTGLEPGHYTVRPEDDDYAFEPVETDLDVVTDLSNVDFVAATLYTLPLGQGLSFVAVPVNPLNPDVQAAFGQDVRVARWDPQAEDYLEAPSNDALMALAPGRGFWTESPDDRDVHVAGEVFPNDQGLTLNLPDGWTMAGNPYERELPWEQLQIPAGGAAARYGFIWDREDETYRLVSTAAGLGGLTTVPKNQGMWLRAHGSTQVSIAAPGAAPASAEVAQRAARHPAENAWIVPIVARAANMLDACSYAGVLPQAAADPAAYRIENPPIIGPYVDVYFVDASGRRLAVDVREAGAAAQSWDFVVSTDLPGLQVEVALPDLSEVPADKTVTLVDKAAGKRIYARTMTCYSYNSGDGGARSFRLEIADRAESGLMITGASAAAARGGVTVSYSLSAEAEVRIEVLNIAGRRVATVDAGQPQPAGVCAASWNGRSGAGTLCPAGRYLVRLEARGADGQQAQALVPLQIER